MYQLIKCFLKTDVKHLSHYKLVDHEKHKERIGEVWHLQQEFLVFVAGNVKISFNIVNTFSILDMGYFSDMAGDIVKQRGEEPICISLPDMYSQSLPLFKTLIMNGKVEGIYKDLETICDLFEFLLGNPEDDQSKYHPDIKLVPYLKEEKEIKKEFIESKDVKKEEYVETKDVKLEEMDIQSSGDESDVSLGEEEAVPRPIKEKPAPIPHEKHRKLVLDERGQNVFEVLPLGWVTVTHNCGIPLYLHMETRVISTTRPYNLGAGSVRKHRIPISAIPCYNYRYYSKLDGKSYSSNAQSATPSQSAPPTPNEATSHTSCRVEASAPAQTCPIAQSRGQASTSDFCVSTDSTADAEKQSSEVPMVEQVAEASAVPAPSSIFPKAKIEKSEDNLRETSLSAEDVHKYCSNLFVFKELEVTKFKSWKDRRSYTKEQNKMRLLKQLAARPTLPEGTIVITVPTVELSSMEGTDGENAMDPTVVKKSKKEWIINPVGKTMVCLLHEYIQQSLKKQPAYKFTMLDNANSPYAATVIVNGMEYGKGVGSSKKIAKSEAARKTLEIMIPEIMDKLPQIKKTEETEEPNLSFFDNVRIEDPRVWDLSKRTSETSPYMILVTCLQRNYGLGATNIREYNNQKNEYTMRFNKREVSVICKNKKEGKQLAAQKLLQQLHPQLTSWGSLLRMYGNRSIRQLKQKKEKETFVLNLKF